MAWEISPCLALVYLTFTNMMIYADRGILASVIKTLESSEGMDLTNAQAGSLGSIFMFGFMLTGFFFAHYSQLKHPFSLIAAGLFLWALTALATGLSRNYWELALARGFSGIGEVSFACLGPPLVLEYAPGSKKTTWIAVFYSAIALGASFGYIFGASISNYFGAWYYPFYFESGLIFILCLIALSIKKDANLIALNSEGTTRSLPEQLKILAKNIQYVFIILGFAAYIFTFGGISFWVLFIQGPFILETEYDLSSLAATRVMGIITIVCGLSGTIIGSLFLDCYLQKYYAAEQNGEISYEKLMFITVEKSSFMLFIVIFIAAVFSITGSVIGGFYMYVGGYAIAAVFLFA